MSITIPLSSDEEQALRERAARMGQDITSYLHGLIRADLSAATPPRDRGFAEILAPVHDDFERSGMTQGELDTLLDGARRELRIP